MTYKVFVDDNFHFMDESERYCDGEYATLAEATARCRAIVDKVLKHLREPGMTAEQLYESYVSFGEDPWIQGGGDFSAWAHARERCAALCPDRGRTIGQSQP